MSLVGRAIAAYEEDQKQEDAWKYQQATQYLQRVQDWIKKTFDTEISLSAKNGNLVVGYFDGIKIRVQQSYGENRLDVEVSCPNCDKRVWVGGCKNLIGLGRVLAGEGTCPSQICGCLRKQPPELTAEERLARAFTDLICEIMDNR